MHPRRRQENIRPLAGLFAISLCALLICCTVQHRADTAQREGANKSSGTSVYSLQAQFGDDQLLEQLKKEQGIERPFAWERWGGRAREKGGTVIGIDQQGMLKEVDFLTTDGGYIVKPSEHIHELNVPIQKSGALELEKYLPNTEFPFRSLIVRAGGCNVHFILLWQALNRSFEKRSVFLDTIDLRIIVEKEGIILLNKLERLLFLSLDLALAEDVNKDGKPDFLVVGSNMITFVRIWTVGEDCEVKPLLFKEGDHFLESVRDKGLSVSKNEVSGTYDVHVTHYEPVTKDSRAYIEVTEMVYRWDSVESVYKIAETHRWLKS